MMRRGSMKKWPVPSFTETESRPRSCSMTAISSWQPPAKFALMTLSFTSSAARTPEDRNAADHQQRASARLRDRREYERVHRGGDGDPATIGPNPRDRRLRDDA